MRLSDDTKAEDVIRLMTEKWELELPTLVISVTGGAKSFNLKPRLKEVFNKGLIKVAVSTGAWIITGKEKSAFEYYYNQKLVQFFCYSYCMW